jgi:phage-related protein
VNIAKMLYLHPLWTVEIDELALHEIEALPVPLKARLALYIERIQSHGLESLEPGAVKHIEGKLWELRLKAQAGIAQALYFTLHPKRVVIVSAYVKKSQKLPQNEKERAERRMKASIVANAGKAEK